MEIASSSNNQNSSKHLIILIGSCNNLRVLCKNVSRRLIALTAAQVFEQSKSEPSLHFIFFMKVFDNFFSFHCMPGDHDTGWMYIFSVLATKGSETRCRLTFRLLNCSRLCFFCRVLHLAVVRGKMWRPSCELRVFNKLIHHVWVIAVDAKQYQPVWFLFFNRLETECVCSQCYCTVCPWAKNIVCNSHLTHFTYFYVEGPDLFFAVNVFFSPSIQNVLNTLLWWRCLGE